MAGSGESRRTVARNRKARYEFLVLEQLECGIVLAGTEVKSLRAGQCSLAESYVRIKKGQMVLVGAHIPEYAFGNVHNHHTVHDRRLLAHRREIAKWERKVREKGTTIVPLEVYFSGSLVKVTVALVRGKKLHDKRQAGKRRTDQRDMDRAMSRRR